MSEHDVEAVVKRIWAEVIHDIEWHDVGPDAQIRRVLALLRSGDRLPGGLVVVPAEPTEAMCMAAVRSIMAYGDLGFGRDKSLKKAAIRYRAMLAAASEGQEQ